MSCITTGTIVDCSQQNPGGVKRVWVAEKDAVDTFTLDANGNMDTITMAAAAPNTFFELEFEDFQGNFTEEFPLNEGGVVAGTQTLNITLGGRNAAYRKVINDLINCRCGFYVIHEEFAGGLWIWGYNDKLHAKASDAADSGTALTDPNIETITFTATSIEKAIIFVPGVAGIPV